MFKFSRVLTVLLLSLASLTAGAGGRPIPMVEIIDQPVHWPSGTPGSIDAVQKAVLRGLADKGWVGEAKAPGEVHATLTRDDWKCEIDVTFTPEHYSIKYAASEHLNYDPVKHLIHRNFNHWLILLRERIDLAIMTGPAAG